MLAVTSFSPEGYELYGKRCLETFVKHWPCHIVVFHEGKPDFEHEKVEYIALENVTGFNSTIERMKRVANSDGGSPYDYRYDAQKFCRKVFAQDATFDFTKVVFWLDADSITHSDVPEDFLTGLIEGVPFCYYGRDSYTETGFIGFNTEHEKFPEFRKNYLSQFTEGKIFKQLKGWNDCIAFDIARQGLGRNLSPGGKGVEHVMSNGPTAKYWDHLKGPRRKLRVRG